MSRTEAPPVPPGLAVLYADAAMIAVDKPAGLHTAPRGRAGEDTLLGRLLERFPEVAALPGRKPGEPGLLHRLDRDTSGVLLAARSPEAFRLLTADFAGGRVRKEYLALCAPAGPAHPGQTLVVESRFAAFGPGRGKVRVVPSGNEHAARGRARRRASPAIYRTEAEVLQVRAGLALVRAVILRGFRHQLRAHLSHLGLPIAGDPLYGAAELPGAPGRLCLHAWRIAFPHPDGGRAMRIEAPCPPEFGEWRLPG